MADLSQDELTVLLIAAEGESMMPIGRWEAPVESLVHKGYLRRVDRFNNYITDAGRKAAEETEKANFKAVINTNLNISDVQNQARARAEELAVLLAELSNYSAAATGDMPMTALRNWGKIILERAKELLK